MRSSSIRKCAFAPCLTWSIPRCADELQPPRGTKIGHTAGPAWLLCAASCVQLLPSCDNRAASHRSPGCQLPLNGALKPGVRGPFWVWDLHKWKETKHHNKSRLNITLSLQHCLKFSSATPCGLSPPQSSRPWKWMLGWGWLQQSVTWVEKGGGAGGRDTTERNKCFWSEKYPWINCHIESLWQRRKLNWCPSCT